MVRGRLTAGFCWSVFFSWYSIKEAIPDKIWIEQGQEENFDFHLPITGEMDQEGLEVFGNQSPEVEKDKIRLDLNESFSLKSWNQGSYSMNCRLLSKQSMPR